jgi:hypothetical protein
MASQKEKQAAYLNNLLIMGLVDERKTAVVSNAKKLPNGEFGMCLLCLKGSTLGIYDTDFRQNVGQKLYEIDLKQITNLKTSSFVLNPYIKFTYENFAYVLADFGDAKNFIAAVTSETGK